MGTLYKYLLWLAFLFAFAQTIVAQETVSKRIEKTYKLTDAGTFSIANKYGNINVFGWNKDEASLQITFTVKHKKKSNAEDLLNRIHPIINANTNTIDVNYEIAESNSGFFSNLIEKINSFDINSSNLQVNYTLYLPKKAELNLSNVFGDVAIEKWSGKLTGEIEHGSITIDENLNTAKILVKSGKLSAKSITKGNLTIKNSTLEMKDSKSLKITSSGSNLTINKITTLEFYSNNDEVTFHEIDTLKGKLKFTILELRHLNTKANLSMRISNFKVSDISNLNATIYIEQESSDISLNINEFSHVFEATLEQGLVRLPKSFEHIETQMLDKSKKLRIIKATYGNQPKGNISIKGKKGIVLLKE